MEPINKTPQPNPKLSQKDPEPEVDSSQQTAEQELQAKEEIIQALMDDKRELAEKNKKLQDEQQEKNSESTSLQDLQDSINSVKSSVDTSKQVVIQSLKSIGIPADESKSLEELVKLLAQKSVSQNKTLNDQTKNAKELAFERYALDSNVKDKKLLKLCFDMGIPDDYLKPQKTIREGRIQTNYIFNDSDAMNIHLDTPDDLGRSKKFILQRLKEANYCHVNLTAAIQECQSRKAIYSNARMH